MFPWSNDIWKPSEKAYARIRRNDVYAVRLRIAPEGVLKKVWRVLSEELTVEGEHLLEGGASLRRIQDDVVEVVSGGEDVFDSLSWTINQTLAKAVAAVDQDASLTVTDEGARR